MITNRRENRDIVGPRVESRKKKRGKSDSQKRMRREEYIRKKKERKDSQKPKVSL